MTGAEVRAVVEAWRGTILFFAGLAGVAFEAIARAGPERYGLILLYGGMMGLPVVMGRDVAAAAPPAAPQPPLPPPPAPPAAPGPPSEATA